MSLKVSQKMKKQYLEAGVQVKIIDLRLLPSSVFNSNIYKEKPTELQPFIDSILEADGILFVVPEYNGSFPGILKYFIDLWKYPDCFENVCTAYIGISSNGFGALRPIEHLQGVMGYRNAYQFPQRVFIDKIYSRFSKDGFRKLHEKEYSIDELLSEQTRGFIDFCRKVLN